MSTLIFAATAALLTLLVLAWLTYPLLRGGRRAAAALRTRRLMNATIYRDQLDELARDRDSGALAEGDFEQARDELQQRLLQDAAGTAAEAPIEPGVDQGATPGKPASRSALLLALGLPLAAVLLYFWLGNPAALQVVAPPPRMTAEQIDGMVAKLAQRMQQHPDDFKGWVMLARSYKALRRFDEAADAYRNVMRLGGDKDADLLADYADLLGVMAGGRLEGPPLALVQQALTLEPTHLTALALAGSAAYAREDYAATRKYWEALLKQLPEDSPEAQQLAATLAEVRAHQTTKRATEGKPAAAGVAASRPSP